MADWIKSVWRLTWEPGAASEMVLLDYGDLMDAEPTIPQEHSVRVQPYLRAAFPEAFDSGNTRFSSEFSAMTQGANVAAVRSAVMAHALVMAGVRQGTLRYEVQGGDVYELRKAAFQRAAPRYLPMYPDGGAAMWSYSVSGGSWVAVTVGGVNV